MNGRKKKARYALTKYIRRLQQKRSSQEKFDVDNPSKFPTDELDTYELPWDKLTPEAPYPGIEFNPRI